MPDLTLSRRTVLTILAASATPAFAQTPEFGQEAQLQPRPVLRLRGQSVWDEGFANLRKSLGVLRAEARKHGLAPGGDGMAHFIDSDDLGFTYEAMLPLAVQPEKAPELAPGVELAQSPAGRALRFQHEGSYDELDAAYEAITAWLDEKGFAATGRFLEEYAAMPERQDEPGLRMTIIIFLR
jgi:effector-binding domain-containing protein